MKYVNVFSLCRGINDFKKYYQSRANIVEVEKSDLVPHSHSILARWRRHFSQLFNTHGVSELRQTDTYCRATSA